MLHKYRMALTQQGKDKLSGRLEVDEWFHGGVAKAGNAFTGKSLVVAAVETGRRGWGRIRLGVVPNRGGWELRKFITANVEKGSHVVTDAHSGYLSALAGYTHEPRNETVPGAPEAYTLLPAVHRVFSLAERWLLGTHQGGVQREHLQSYLDEFTSAGTGATPTTVDYCSCGCSNTR